MLSAACSLAGCSFVTAATGPSPPTAAHCGHLRASAITDTVVAVLLGVPAIWLMVESTRTDDPGELFALGAGVGLIAGTEVISAGYGYVKGQGCRPE